MNVQLLVYDGFRELDLFGAQEVFTRTAAAGARIVVERVRIGSGTVTSGYGLQVHVPPVLGSGRTPDVLLVPGATGFLRCVGEIHGRRGRWRSWGGDRDCPRRRRAGGRGGVGVVLLGEGEMLSGRSIAAPAGAAERLAQAGARVVSAALVDDGDIISGVGAGAGIDVGLRLLERAGGGDLAERIADAMGHPRVPVEVTA
jgi:transcriptional regulator GlxA family with amidase domain